jgi:hypothetical protein
MVQTVSAHSGAMRLGVLKAMAVAEAQALMHCAH